MNISPLSFHPPSCPLPRFTEEEQVKFDEFRSATCRQPFDNSIQTPFLANNSFPSIIGI
ncbi:Hypothetical predicted protein [Olea europaea subsp. europaea]|uniref:Uncharacterized protein n=1 Tax=Olea europaea subsp. europaea TaxID=158383 RepID=A0A8S0TSW1_OLEEU|nr:Hypothetical predicted protein [Olea europaea subsp. europaea]